MWLKSKCDFSIFENSTYDSNLCVVIHVLKNCPHKQELSSVDAHYVLIMPASIGQPLHINYRGKQTD